jgi:hypothetical protein
MYGLELTDLGSQFRLGRLKNVRDRIVHEALRPPIHIRLLDFPSALYWDALLDILGLAAQRVDGQVLAAHHIEEWFPGLGPQRVVGQPHASPSGAPVHRARWNGSREQISCRESVTGSFIPSNSSIIPARTASTPRAALWCQYRKLWIWPTRLTSMSRKAIT